MSYAVTTFPDAIYTYVIQILVVIKDRVVTAIEVENSKIMEPLFNIRRKRIKYLTANCFIKSYYILGLFVIKSYTAFIILIIKDSKRLFFESFIISIINAV